MRGPVLLLAALVATAAAAQAPAPLPSPAALAASAAARPASAAASAAAPACLAPAQVNASHLYGLWRAEQDGTWHAATLLIERHPEFAQSFRGTINRNGERSLLAGDIEDGEFTLEESADGKRIAATWVGDVVPASCGREIRGTWQAEGDTAARRFVLRKVGS